MTELDKDGTPRTDAVVNWDTERTLVADLCKILERDLAALQTRYDALAKENAAQLAELVAISDALGTNDGHSSVSHIVALRERLAASERDAQRYRWLRGMHGTASDTDYIMVNGYGDLPMAGVDAAIDAALASDPPRERTTPVDEQRKGERRVAENWGFARINGWVRQTPLNGIDRRSKAGTISDRRTT